MCTNEKVPIYDRRHVNIVMNLQEEREFLSPLPSSKWGGPGLMMMTPPHLLTRETSGLRLSQLPSGHHNKVHDFDARRNDRRIFLVILYELISYQPMNSEKYVTQKDGIRLVQDAHELFIIRRTFVGDLGPYARRIKFHLALTPGQEMGCVCLSEA